jgi:pyruvate dehydrogenase E1 component beta subunit
VAEVKRPGDDCTIIAISSMVGLALEAAQTLSREDEISVEVVDPRTLVPLDEETLVESVRKTGYALIVDEASLRYGVTGELAALVTEAAFDYLDAPVKRIGAADVPIPFSPSLEGAAIPHSETIVEAVRALRGKIRR